MTLIDVSRTVAPGIALPPGATPPSTSVVVDIGADSPSRVTRLENWTTHLLTHVDVPRHFAVDGASLDAIALDRFHGAATVVQVDGHAVMPEDVPDVPPGHNLLFRTANSGRPTDVFHPDHVFVHPATVPVLLDRRPNLVGIDYFGVDAHGDPTCPAHHALLGAGVLLLEGLDLSDAPAGAYELWALPLKIADGDGSPVRAVLVPQPLEATRPS
ncbi:cyclase family protein [Jatrophihabitans sp. YIM 134969]